MLLHNASRVGVDCCGELGGGNHLRLEQQSDRGFVGHELEVATSCGCNLGPDAVVVLECCVKEIAEGITCYHFHTRAQWRSFIWYMTFTR